MGLKIPLKNKVKQKKTKQSWVWSHQVAFICLSLFSLKYTVLRRWIHKFKLKIIFHYFRPFLIMFSMFTLPGQWHCRTLQYMARVISQRRKILRFSQVLFSSKKKVVKSIFICFLFKWKRAHTSVMCTMFQFKILAYYILLLLGVAFHIIDPVFQVWIIWKSFERTIG